MQPRAKGKPPVVLVDGDAESLQVLRRAVARLGCRVTRFDQSERVHALAEEQRILADTVQVLQQQLARRAGGASVMVGQSDAMRKLAGEIVDFAGSAATVLITGESGTGKEVVANMVHQTSPRRDKPFLILNCSAISESLFESEMFGHRRGAFTGAVETRGGYLQAAAGGTLFLDEIGDLALASQAKILRFIEQKTYLPLGDNQMRRADVRIIAATNQALEGLVAEKKFRQDLFYRLSVCTLQVPPLRERKEDIPLLAQYFALQFAVETGKDVEGFDDDALAALAAYDYPGNIRELRNIVESCVIRCRHAGALRADDLAALPARERAPSPDAWPLDTLRFEEVERRLYREALRQAGHNVSAAARRLAVDRSRLRRRMKALGMTAA